MRWLILGIIAIAIGLALSFLLTGGQLVSLEYTDFPRDKLEKFITAETLEAELTLSGPPEAEVGSPWTPWAMKLLPGTFLVDVKINGHPASLVVDTGAAQTVLSPRIAVAAQVSLTSSRLIVQHGGGEVPVYMGWVQELELRDLKVQGLPVLVSGKQPVLKLLGLPVWSLDGLLGMETLQRLAFTLDYGRGIVIFRRESPSIQAPSAPLRLLQDRGPGDIEQARPIVDCLLEGSGPFPCWLDTGTSAPVLVPPEVWEMLGLEGQKRTRLRIRLGEIELTDVPAVRARYSYIMIGSNIFQAQGFKRLTLDFLAGKLYLER